ncbi:M20 metallopeptidase family protein [Inconstantimicrobium porci]|uniref:Amidohydrolase n=1 Tax=Inconstantimicrobium porci TaxID=2652291 RepID=A0A7X2MVI2_9CLOT|nr:amidohydrolase [Inconstantimicrobium porci]MDD6770217.1 amidohydrolase [Inconstantimicrobium porci]MSR89856.1 amidohydrolase [Inconstantimicrobium porci]
MDIYKEALDIEDILISLRRDFHMHPELGFEEHRTSGKIKEFLDSLNIPYETYAGTGVCGIITGEKKSDETRVIALRADIDALPMQEKNTCEYKSLNEGRMHACGHDAHTTILLGTAKLLNDHKSEFSGIVKLIFEPAEETTGGAPVMIKEGVLENPHVDAIIGLHVDESMEYGNIKIKYGVVNAASNPFTIKIKGKGGHGAQPHTTVDPIVIASQVVLSLQTIVSREIAPVNPSLITIGSIQGGTAQNIIPDEVCLKGIIRTMTKEDREYAKKRLREVVNGICVTMRAEADIEIEESYPCLYNEDSMVDVVKTAACTEIGEEHVLNQKNPKMGVESFAYFAEQRDSAFYFLGIANKEKNIIHPLHNSLFDIDERALAVGVAIQTKAVLNYLTK